MAREETNFRLQVLSEGVEALAMDAEEQIRWIGEAHPDELGLAFDDGWTLIPSLELDGVVFPQQVRTMLDEINRRLHMMSGAENAALWTHAAIRSDPHWAELRLLARQVLGLQTWPPAAAGRL